MFEVLEVLREKDGTPISATVKFGLMKPDAAKASTSGKSKLVGGTGGTKLIDGTDIRCSANLFVPVK